MVQGTLLYPSREDAPLRPDTYYGLTQVQSGTADEVLFARPIIFLSVILRMGYVYGPGILEPARGYPTAA